MRGCTEHALRPINECMSAWLREDEAWLPGRPAHALVHLDDEKRHGLGFPQSVERDVRAVIALESGRPVSPTP